MPTGTVTYEAHIAYGGVISTDVLVTVTSRKRVCERTCRRHRRRRQRECDARCGNRNEPVDSQSAPHPDSDDTSA